jgi:hypothetical protein
MVNSVYIITFILQYTDAKSCTYISVKKIATIFIIMFYQVKIRQRPKIAAILITLIATILSLYYLTVQRFNVDQIQSARSLSMKNCPCYPLFFITYLAFCSLHDGPRS